MKDINSILDVLTLNTGKISYLYKNLIDQSTYGFNENERILSASIIKLFIMGAVFSEIEKKNLSEDDTLILLEKEYVPPAGVLTFLKEGLNLTVYDTIVLMIIVSDNVATNLLIDLVGFSTINKFIEENNYESCVLQRKMYDENAIKSGKENYITAKGVSQFLEDIYKGTLVSVMRSHQMLEILKGQQLNDMFPFFIDMNTKETFVEIAHKTGENKGVAHDVGIFFTKKPFILCACGNDLTDKKFNIDIAYIAYKLYERHHLI